MQVRNLGSPFEASSSASASDEGQACHPQKGRTSTRIAFVRWSILPSPFTRPQHPPINTHRHPPKPLLGQRGVGLTSIAVPTTPPTFTAVADHSSKRRSEQRTRTYIQRRLGQGDNARLAEFQIKIDGGPRGEERQDRWPGMETRACSTTEPSRPRRPTFCDVRIPIPGVWAP